jgi:hypothetical protein
LSKVQLRLLYPFYQGSWTWFYSWLATGIAMKLTVFFTDQEPVSECVRV